MAYNEKPTSTVEYLAQEGFIIYLDTNIFDAYKGKMPAPQAGHCVIPQDVMTELEAYSRKYGLMTDLPPEVFDSKKSEIPQKDFVNQILGNKERFLPREEVVKATVKLQDIVDIIYQENSTYFATRGGEVPGPKDRSLIATAIAQTIYSPKVALCSSDTQLGLTANFTFRALRSFDHSAVGRLLRNHQFAIYAMSYSDKCALEEKFNSREGDPDSYRFKDEYNTRQGVEKILSDIIIAEGCVDLFDEKRLAAAEMLLSHLPENPTDDLSGVVRAVSNLNILSGGLPETKNTLSLLGKIQNKMPEVNAMLAKYNITLDQLEAAIGELDKINNELSALEQEYDTHVEQLKSQQKNLSKY